MSKFQQIGIFWMFSLLEVQIEPIEVSEQIQQIELIYLAGVQI